MSAAPSRWLAGWLAVAGAGCGGITLSDIVSPRPVPPASCLVVGFLGGRDAWDDREKGVRRLALAMRNRAKGRFAETFENRRQSVAERFVTRALDADGNGAIEPDEADGVTLVLYGQSFGGDATVRFARRLARQGIPVHLTIQVDSVGIGDGTIPPNVRYAANFYQDEGLLIAGEHPIRAAETEQTEILGNWELDYSTPPGSEISLEGLSIWKRLFRVAHAKMDRDPRVWAAVETLVAAACERRDLVRVAAGIDPERDEISGGVPFSSDTGRASSP